MSQSEQIDKLAQALNQAQAVIQPALKDSTNPFFKSKYADLGAIWSVIKDPLTKNGLSVFQGCASRDGIDYLETTLLHNSGQWIKSEIHLFLMKQDAQGMGSAITYARRYALAAALGVTQEDDDGQQASQPAPIRKSIPETTDLKAGLTLGSKLSALAKKGDIDQDTINGVFKKYAVDDFSKLPETVAKKMLDVFEPKSTAV